MYHNKHFTVKEANYLLPNIKLILKDIIKLKKSLDNSNYNLYNHHFFGGVGTNGSGKYPDDLVKLIDLIKEITDQGIQVKNIDNGLIDFPHIRENGEEVYLCFFYGEDVINFWHSIKDGFSGRRDINEL